MTVQTVINRAERAMKAAENVSDLIDAGIELEQASRHKAVEDGYIQNAQKHQYALTILETMKRSIEKFGA